jgi:hypothetical protein
MTDDETDDTTELSFSEVMDFAVEQTEEEASEFPGDVPNHAGALLNERASELLQTLANVQITRAHEDLDDPTDEEITEALAQDAIDIILALGTLKYEYDLDIVEAFQTRKEQIEMFQNADSQQELMQAMMESEAVDGDELPIAMPDEDEELDREAPDDPKLTME